MSSIDTVRAIIGDPIQYDRATAAGDGASLEFQLPNYPTVLNSEKVVVGVTAITKPADYSIDNEIGLITFVVAPSGNVIITSKFSLLTDASIQAFLDLEGANIKLAAADALDAIASSQALIQKKIKLLDLQTDGPALATALHKLADSLRKQVTELAGVEDNDFDWAELVYDDPSLHEKLLKDVMRGM